MIIGVTLIIICFFIANCILTLYPWAMDKQDSELTYIARNRKARHDYTIVDSFEAGIELMGSEVKSMREGKISLSDSYAVIENGQVILRNLHINPYKLATQEKQDPLRPRRLLLNKREIRKLFIKTEQQGMALIPLSVYFKGKYVKIELGLAEGRKKYDKREAIAEAEAKRRIQRATKQDMRKPK
jgi:SsrA-binding protein